MPRKEYTDRWNQPLVNPPITSDDYELQRESERDYDSFGRDEIEQIILEHSKKLGW